MDASKPTFVLRPNPTAQQTGVIDLTKSDTEPDDVIEEKPFTPTPTRPRTATSRHDAPTPRQEVLSQGRQPAFGTSPKTHVDRKRRLDDPESADDSDSSDDFFVKTHPKYKAAKTAARMLNVSLVDVLVQGVKSIKDFPAPPATNDELLQQVKAQLTEMANAYRLANKKFVSLIEISESLIQIRKNFSDVAYRWNILDDRTIELRRQLQRVEHALSGSSGVFPTRDPSPSAEIPRGSPSDCIGTPTDTGDDPDDMVIDESTTPAEQRPVQRRE